MRASARRFAGMPLIAAIFYAVWLCGAAGTSGKLRAADGQAKPRVLLLGDSISIGYTPGVTKKLEDVATVERPRANCGPTSRGLENLDAWLGNGRWDVIHFNFGLHDLKYMGPNGENLANPKLPTSRRQVPPEQYEKNLRELVSRLQKTGATLIWCSTTPVPEGAGGRVPGDEVEYNTIAAKIMKEQQIAIHDLYAFAKPRLDSIQRKANVHFTPEGSEALAEQVAGAIRQALSRKP